MALSVGAVTAGVKLHPSETGINVGEHPFARYLRACATTVELRFNLWANNSSSIQSLPWMLMGRSSIELVSLMIGMLNTLAQQMIPCWQGDGLRHTGI